MSDGREPDDAGRPAPGPSGGDSDDFDPDAWFEAQFGSRPPASSQPPAASSPAHPPVPPVLPPPALIPPPTLTPPPALIPPPVQRPDLPPELAPPAASGADVPTQEVPATEAPTQAVPASELMGDAATELLRQPGPPGVGDAPIDGDVDGGALDDVFGADQFREYPSETLLRPNRATPSSAAPSAPAVPPAVLPPTMGPGVAGLARDTTGGVHIPGYFDIGERGDPVPGPVGAGSYPGTSAAVGSAGVGPASAGFATAGATSEGEARRSSGTAGAGGAGSDQKSGLTQTQKTLLWVSGGLLALIALFALFLLGTRIPEWTAEPAPIVTPEPEPEPEPDPLEGVPDDVPLPEGVWAWDLLRGGECLDPFESPWAEEFTVVDCAEPHAAQLIQRAEFPEAGDEFPGPEALAAPLSLVCSSPDVLNFDAASAYDDIEVQTAYPVTAEEWESGYRDFFCFITRAEGEPLEGSLVVEGADGTGSTDEGTEG